MEDRDLSSRVEGREEDTGATALRFTLRQHDGTSRERTADNATSSCRESDDTSAVILLVIQSEI